jgi:sugar phosphate isomerase/epimerase
MSIRRRDLVHAMPLALAQGQPAVESWNPRLSVTSISLDQFSRRHAIHLLRRLGIPRVNVKDVHLPLTLSAEQQRAAAAEFRAAGLEIVSCGVIYFLEDDAADIRRKFEYARNIGAPLIVAGPTAATLPQLAPFVREFGIRVAVHNHGPEDRHFPSPATVAEQIRGLDERIGFCVDIGHTARAGMSPVDAVRLAGTRLFDLHLKDLRDVGDARSLVPCGDGVLPIVEMAAELKRMRYRNTLTIEYEIDPFDPLPGMMKSHGFLKGVLDALRRG